METSELRIGAYVMYEPNGEICRVSELAGNKFIRASVVNYPNTSIGRYLAPIVLTEEWLLKFGFTKRTYSSGHPEYHIYPKGHHSNINCLLFEGKLRVSIINQSICTINFVHQLQNLYFALTGEELTLTDTK